jgi:hypothetical protein
MQKQNRHVQRITPRYRRNESDVLQTSERHKSTPPCPRSAVGTHSLTYSATHSLTGGRAKAQCPIIHAEASLSEPRSRLLTMPAAWSALLSRHGVKVRLSRRLRLLPHEHDNPRNGDPREAHPPAHVVQEVLGILPARSARALRRALSLLTGLGFRV